MKFCLLLAAGAAIWSCVASAGEGEVVFASPFADHMVLQRDVKVPVWGTAVPGAKVSVAFGDIRRETVAGPGGDWRVDLPPMTACVTGRTLSANDVRVSDVLVGEVWLCAGQSNMGVSLCGASPHSRDRQGSLVAQMTCLPLVRFARTDATRYDSRPQRRTRTPVVWRAFTPASLRSPSFSAVATYFAIDLAHAMPKMPIGLVGVYRGATGIDSWTPCKGTPARTKDRDDCQPGVFWNTVVNPWTPFAARGMIWYQGEHDAKWHDTYAAKLRLLYDGWRTAFENPDLRFYFAQLCSWGSNIAPMQEAQAQFADSEPNAAIAVINDVGNLTDIHPNDKEPVGRRLALHALRRDYGAETGLSGIRADSPSVASVAFTNGQAVVEFRNASALYLYNRDFSVSNGFEIAGSDGKWHRARIANLVVSKAWGTGKPVYNGQFDAPRAVLEAEGVPAPCAVRYLHAFPWQGTIYNEADLPLGAFNITQGR